MNIAFFDAKDYDLPYFTRFGEQMGIKFKFFKVGLNEDTAGLADGFDGVCVFVNDEINSAVIDRLHSQKVGIIALRCAGYNNVDLPHCKGKVRVVHVPAYSPHSVAEHTMAMLLTSIRRIHKAFNRTKEFNFSLNGLVGIELHGKTVGIVGTGKIGGVFARICNGFGMNVLAYDKYPARDLPVTYVDLNKLFAESDIISLHCPLTEETRHIVDGNAIAAMKRGVIIINTSRGALIDSEALLEGIKARRVGAACLDVYEEESEIFFEDYSGHIVEDDILARLITMPNVLVTSHQAFLTEEALENIARVTVENIVELRDENECKNELTRD